ncbi:hypothetical protein ABZP36_026104 [Zizania latifolia]
MGRSPCLEAHYTEIFRPNPRDFPGKRSGIFPLSSLDSQRPRLAQAPPPLASVTPPPPPPLSRAPRRPVLLPPPLSRVHRHPLTRIRRRLSRLLAMVGWRQVVGGARSVRHRLGAAAEAAAKQDGRVFAANYSSRSVNAPFGLGQYVNLLKAQAFASRGVPMNFHQLIRNAGISTTRNLLAADDAMVPISSPLTSPIGDGEETDKKGAVVKQSKVQAIKKDIKQSPKKVNLVAKLVRGMRVEDALLQLQVTVKRAAKTVYQVIHSARANAAHNHGLDPDKLIVEEAFVGKGLYLKRLSYHAKGRSGIMVRPRCRLTVVVREATAEEEAKIAKLRVSNYKKLTRKEKQLMPHRLIEVSPRWARKRKEEAGAEA